MNKNVYMLLLALVLGSVSSVFAINVGDVVKGKASEGGEKLTWTVEGESGRGLFYKNKSDGVTRTMPVKEDGELPAGWELVSQAPEAAADGVHVGDLSTIPEAGNEDEDDDDDSAIEDDDGEEEGDDVAFDDDDEVNLPDNTGGVATALSPDNTAALKAVVNAAAAASRPAAAPSMVLPTSLGSDSENDGDDEADDSDGPVEIKHATSRVPVASPTRRPAVRAPAAPSVASPPRVAVKPTTRAMAQKWAAMAKINVAQRRKAAAAASHAARPAPTVPAPAYPPMFSRPIASPPPVALPPGPTSNPAEADRILAQAADAARRKAKWRKSVLSAQNPRVALGAAMHEGGDYNLSARERAQLVSEVRRKYPSLNRSAGGPLSPEVSLPVSSLPPAPQPVTQKGLLSSLNSPMGRILIMMLLAGGAGGYGVKRWSHRYDGLSDKQIDALPMNRLKKMVLKASRAGRRWFGGAPHQKPSEQMHPLVQQVARSGPSEAAAQKEWFYRRWMNGARNWWQHRRRASAA